MMAFKLTLISLAVSRLHSRDIRAQQRPAAIDAASMPRMPPVLRHPAGIPRDRLSTTLQLWFTDAVTSPLDEARFRASTMDAAERVKLTGKIRESWDRARAGQCTPADWGRIASAINIGFALARLGIASDRVSDFDAAADALTSWARRLRDTGSWTLRGGEVRALDLALEIHEVQLQFASRGELIAANDRVIAMDNQARALAARGAAVVHVDDLLAAEPA